MKEMIKANYDRIKAETKQIVADELCRIKGDPELCHMLPKQDKQKMTELYKNSSLLDD